MTDKERVEALDRWIEGAGRYLERAGRAIDELIDAKNGDLITAVGDFSALKGYVEGLIRGQAGLKELTTRFN